MTDITRRGLLGAAGGIAVAGGLAACAGTGGNTAPKTGGGGGSATNQIEFWSNHPATSKDTELKLIAGFEKANPGLKVKLVDAGKNYEEVGQKFSAALGGGNQPDVVVVSDVTWFNFALNKRLADISTLLKGNGLSSDDYVDSLYADYNFQGTEHYALPYSRSTPLFYYNKDVWKKAGLPDRGPKDWDEMTSWCPALQKAIGSGKTPIVLDDGSNYLDWTFQSIAWSYGGGYSDKWNPTFSSAKTVKAGKVLQGWAQKKYVQFSTDSQRDFSAGLGAVLLESTGDISGIQKDGKFEFGVAFVPAPNGIKTCPTGGAGLAIPEGISPARKKNAIKFAEYMTNAKSTITFSQATGYMPVRKSALDDPAEKAYLAKDPKYALAVKQLPQTRPQDYARVFVPGGGARIGQALDKIASGSDVVSTFKALDADIKSRYETQVKPQLKS